MSETFGAMTLRSNDIQAATGNAPILEGTLSEFREISILSLCKPVPFSTPYKFAVVGSETDDRFAFWRSHLAECSCFRSVGISSL